MSQALEFLVIIAWNVYIANKPATIRRVLREFIKEHKPDVFVLMEASNLYGELATLGYTVVQLKSTPLRKGNQPAQGNIAILVDPSYTVRHRWTLRMLTFWRGPKHGWPQDPRVYRSVKIRKKNDPTARTWVVTGAHTPFGAEARLESRQRLVAWLKGGKDGRPHILNLDANMGIREFRSSIAEPSGAEAAKPETGAPIDLEAHKNCELVNQVSLGKGPSDHPAIKRKYAARRRAA